MKLETAIGLASQAHWGQMDKGGKPYILHPLRVMLAVPDEAKVVAVLHDVLEDTETTLSDLRHYGLTVPQELALLLVTREPGITYFDYIRRIVASKDKLALAVKLADIADNSDPKRTDVLPPDEAVGMAKRYQKALAILRGEKPVEAH